MRINLIRRSVILRAIAIFIWLPLQVFAQAGTARLAGCADPAKLADGLKALQELPWAGISPEHVAQIWPTETKGETCDHCIRLVSDGRVIENELFCGESLHFDTGQEPESDAWQKARLESIAIKYTTRTAKERDLVEKLLTDSVIRGRKVEEGRGVMTGLGWTRDLRWTDQQPEVRTCDLSIARQHLEAKWRRSGMEWLVIFGLSCEPVK
jgi:hypothetical protein